jgi:putative ATPase
VKFEEGALEHLVYTADGDARSLLNALELAIETSVDSWPAPEDSSVFVSISVAEESIQRKVVLYDKDGDYHYDTISAFIKSIRGSDPDAALYWVSRMIYAGEDPSFIFRRLLISAAEDIGLADPQAVQVVYSCAQAFDRIGMPEGQFHLSLAALYLSTCPKSNSTLGYFDALKAVEAEGAEVPNHLKDASRDSAGFGHGQGYKYPHAYTDHWVAQQYLPSSLAKSVFYTPGSLGLEGERKRSILERREAQLSLLPEDSETDASVWSKEGERRRKWHARAEGLASQRLTIARRWLFDSMSPRRTDSILVIDPRKGFYALEALRRAQEGHVAVFLRDSSAKEQLERLTTDLPYLARPSVAVFDKSRPPASTLLEDSFGFSSFEWLIYCEPPTEGTVEQIPSSLFSSALRGLEAKNDFHCACFDILSGPSSALSSLLDLNCVEPNSSTLALLESLRVFELEWGGGPRFCPDQKGKTEESLKKTFENLVRDSGISTRDFEIVHKKLFFTQSSSDRDVQGFLDQNAAYVDALGSCLGKQAVREIKSLLDSLPPSIRWPLFVARIGF